MEILEIENLTFTYPEQPVPVLNNISFKVASGEFIVLCGPSGSGKTTLLKMMKNELRPFGKSEGKILFCGKEYGALSERELASEIGFVMQNPDAQIVTDEVWHELAFGLENLGCPRDEIQRKVGEMANYFGITDWYHEKTDSLSGGQKQMLNLTSVMVMSPKVLLLDEPTSQLDPIAAEHFISTIYRLNRELGLTVILSEHRLEDVFPLADKVLVMNEGRIAAFDRPADVCRLLSESTVSHGFPTASRIWQQTGRKGQCPLSVRDGRQWLESCIQSHDLIVTQTDVCAHTAEEKAESAIRMKNVWFRYERNTKDILTGATIDIPKGKITAILGGNGSGKTTTLSVLTGALKPYRGSVHWLGQSKPADGTGYKCVSMLPQNPEIVFLHDSVEEDWKNMIRSYDSKADVEKTMSEMASKLNLPLEILKHNPMDLSGGELQKCALGKILFGHPQILLLDEPTKGLDAFSKEHLTEVLNQCIAAGMTILLVTHDVEFAAECADYCIMAFDGKLLSPATPVAFFSANHFFTTASYRISSEYMKGAVTVSAVCDRLKEVGHAGA